MFWVGVCLGIGLINVGISMVVGVFVGRFFGEWSMFLGELEVVEKVGIVVVFGGRAWVSSLPKFFLGKYFQFWKLPPLFCINSRDNVYYPIFLTCYIIWKTGIKYAVICIAGMGTLVKIVL